MEKEKADFQKQNQETANRVSILTIIINVILALLKFLAGIIANSGAMVSDAIHSASDVLSTFVVMIGIRISAKEEDARHPYGHDRMECVAAIILAVILGITGVLIGWHAVQKIINKETIEIPGTLALIAAFVSIVVKEWMYWYTRAAAKKINSSALMADAWHHRSDALSSIGSLIGIAGARLGFPVLEPIAALVIALMVIKVAFDIAKDSIDKMVDESIDLEKEAEIREKVLSHQEVCTVDDLKTRMFGASFYLDLEIAMDGNMTLNESHAVAEKIHDELEIAYPELKHCMVHVNPAENKEEENENNIESG